MAEMAKRREALLERLDLMKIKFPVMAINGEFERPLAKTRRLWRELDDFTNLVLPDKGHLSAVMKGFIPDAYIDGMAAFSAGVRPDPVQLSERPFETDLGDRPSGQARSSSRQTFVITAASQNASRLASSTSVRVAFLR